MRLIAHRGNTEGPSPRDENNPDYICRALQQGYDVEIDVRLVGNKWYLGHDEPQYQVYYEFLQNPNLWCHAKNHEAFDVLIQKKDEKVHYFWHQEDEYTLTSNRLAWVYPGQPLFPGCVAVMPDKHWLPEEMKICYGICSDYVSAYNRPELWK